jgi:hypothetical protein
VITKGTKPAPSVESSSDDGTTPNATATDVEGTLEMLNLATANIVNNRELFADHENVIMAAVNKLATELVPVS